MSNIKYPIFIDDKFIYLYYVPHLYWCQIYTIDPTPFESKKKKQRKSRYDSNEYALADYDDETGSQSSKHSSKDSIDGKPTKTRALKKKRELRPIYLVVSCLVIVMAGSVSVALFFIIGSRGTGQNIGKYDSAVYKWIIFVIIIVFFVAVVLINTFYNLLF